MLPPPPPPTPALASGLRPILPIPPSLPQSDGEGLPASELDAPTRRALEALLQRHYMTLDLDTPGLRVLCLDPPIFTVDAFLPRDRCDDVVAAAEATGLMVASKIGAGNVAAGGGNTYNERRTSTSMLVDAGALACSPRLERLVTDIQARGRGLLQAKKWRAWGKPGKMPAPGQYTYESCQVARYERGQHFLAHEDAFPRGLAQSNGFQRAATLLLYLNDVPLGGRTRFDLLGLSVQPRKGRLLVFFPAQADGAADGRTLHTAEDAGETTKHVLQQWVACGMGALPSAAVAAVAAEQQQQQQQQGQGQPRVEASTPVASATAAGEVQRGKETGAQAGKRTTAKQGGGGTGGGGKRKGFGSTKR